MSDDTAVILLGSESADFLRLDVLAASGRDWKSVHIAIRAGGIEGCVGAELMGGEFAAFRDQLALLHKTLRGEALFSAVEGWLDLRLKGDGRGHVHAEITLRDLTHSAPGPCLTFSLELDQTQLPDLIRALDGVLAR